MSADAPDLRRNLGIFAVCALVLLSACAATVESTVSDEETIERYEMTITVPEIGYQAIADGLREQGFDSSRPLRDALLTDLDVLGGQADSVEYQSELSDDEQTRTVVLTVTGFRPSENGNVTLEEVDGRLVYEDRILTEDTVLGDQAISLTTSGTLDISFDARYTLTMPYNITDSNADSVSGRTAEWQRAGMDEAFVVQAESEIPVEPEGDGGIPWGLLVVAGVVMLGAVGAIAYFMGMFGGREESLPWSGLVIDEVRTRDGITDLVVRNAGEETWEAAGKSIEDAHGNRNRLPEAVSIAPGATEVLRFDRSDGEVFESAEGEDVTLHTRDGERAVRWEQQNG